jgi:Flp pilus assembly protein TadD
LGQAEQAVPLLQKAADLNPRAPVLFYELGRALKAVGRTAEAERALARVRELRVAELENDVKALRKP